MLNKLPRLVAALAFLVGLFGFSISLPLLTGLKTTMFFVLGLTSWGFFLWRMLCSRFTEGFYAGWIWSAILHLACIPLSPFIGGVLGVSGGILALIALMLVLSLVGLFSDLRLGVSLASDKDDLPPDA